MTDDSKRELRRDPRINVELEILLRSPSGDEEHRTENISYRGVFIICEEPMPLRTLVRVQLKPDDGAAPVELLGLIAHRVTLAEATSRGEAPGMGVQLFAVDPAQRERWRSYVQARYEQDPRAKRELAQLTQPYVKFSFNSPDQLKQAAIEHFSRGQVFIYSSNLYEAGTEVWFETQHPRAKTLFRVPAQVLRSVAAPKQQRGMELRFEDGAALKDALLKFLDQGRQVD